MPNVTIRPARAATTARASAVCSASLRWMAASAAIIHNTASGSRSATSNAAAAIAGAELRPTGSSTIVDPTIPAERICSAIRNRWSWLHTTTGGAKPGPTPRSAVSCSMVWSEISGQSCLGKLSRDTGHNRVPDPPDRMTGTIWPSAADGFGGLASIILLEPYLAGWIVLTELY